MASIEQIKGSDGSGNANMATVQNSRAPLASTIIVDTVLGINPAGFAGTMGTPHTFTDPITSETITVISEATAVDFIGHVDGSNLEIDTIAPGYTDAGSEVGDIIVIRPTTQYADNLASVLEVVHEDDGTLKANTVDTTELAAGAATMPKQDNPYMFRAYRNAAQNTGAGAFVVVAFDTENFDINNNFAAGAYTAPVSGYYQFNYTVAMTIPAPDTYEIALYVNGAIASRGARDNVNTVQIAINGADLIHLTAGDVVDVRASAGTARAIVTGGSNTFFSGHCVRQDP